MGARVIAAASSQEKLDVALAAGAESGVVYGTGVLDRESQKTLSDSIKSACAPDGPNVIYDPVGGDYSEPALRSIAWEGRFLVVGFPAGIARLPLNLPLLKGCDIRGIFWGAAIKRDPARHHEATAELMRLYAAGSIRPRIHARFSLSQAAEALQVLASRRAAGKVVIAVDSNSHLT
jgi:NADPH2:quinone reductase